MFAFIIVLYSSLAFSYLFVQLSDAVSVIGREDFPDKWETLLPVCNDSLIISLLALCSGIHVLSLVYT